MSANKEFNRMLDALIISRTVVLSVLRQIGINHYKEHELAKIVRRAAIDLVSKERSYQTAAGVKSREQRGAQLRSE